MCQRGNVFPIKDYSGSKRRNSLSSKDSSWSKRWGNFSSKDSKVFFQITSSLTRWKISLSGIFYPSISVFFQEWNLFLLMPWERTVPPADQTRPRRTSSLPTASYSICRRGRARSRRSLVAHPTGTAGTSSPQTSLLGNLPDLVSCLGSCLAATLTGALAGAGTGTGMEALIGR